MKKPKQTLAVKVMLSIILVEFFIMFSLAKIPQIDKIHPLLIALGDTLILGIVILVIIKYTLRPLGDIIEAMEKIKEGRLDTRLKIHRSDEMGVIAEKVNNMAMGLDELYREMRHKEKLLTIITDGVDEEIMLLSSDFKILWANKQVSKTTGVAEDKIIGNYCYKVSHRLENPCQAPAHICPIEELSNNRKSINILHTHMDKDNKPVYFEISVYPIIAADQKDKLYIHISRDVTEKIKILHELQKAKDEIEKYSHQLEDIVEKRTRKLTEATEKLKQTEAQLIQTGKMAAVGQLASGVAHEINNPLTVISNNALILKMLLEKQKNFTMTEITGTLKEMEEAVISCKKITRSLLEFSHTSKGKHELISLNEAIEKVFSLIGHEMKINNIAVEKILQPDLPVIEGDFQLLQQVLFNMLINSRWAIQKKSQETGGTITIKSHYNKDADSISVSISDTGIGIPKENIGRLFEAFYTTKDVGTGTGLGLYLSYNIIKAHGGKIEAQSEAGLGTTFKITLPAGNSKLKAD